MLFDDDTLFGILFQLPYEEALDKLLVCQDFYRILSDPYFWKKKVEADFGESAVLEASHDNECINWKSIYEFHEQLKPYSVKNMSQRNKPELPHVYYFTRTIDQDNYKRLILYFAYGINDMLNDNACLTILNRAVGPSKRRLYWMLTDHLIPSNKKLWQHAADHLLKAIVTIDNNTPFVIEDVFRLIDKSDELPHYFIYITLGRSKTPQLFYRFCERYKCEGDTFFKGIGNHQNTELLVNYEHDNGPLRPHFVKQILLGAIEKSHLRFIRYLRSKYPNIVTSEQMLYSCRIIISTPSLGVVKYALECSRIDTAVVETREVALQKLMEVNNTINLSGHKKRYVGKWLIDMENLAREWGLYNHTS